MRTKENHYNKCWLLVSYLINHTLKGKFSLQWHGAVTFLSSFNFKRPSIVSWAKWYSTSLYFILWHYHAMMTMTLAVRTRLEGSIAWATASLVIQSRFKWPRDRHYCEFPSWHDSFVTYRWFTVFFFCLCPPTAAGLIIIECLQTELTHGKW